MRPVSAGRGLIQGCSRLQVAAPVLRADVSPGCFREYAEGDGLALPVAVYVLG